MPITKLNEKSMLVTLKISQFTARKEDREVSKEIEETHQTKGDAGKYQKLLLNKKAIGNIQTIVGKARAFHYENTLPWGDEGSRLLPTKRYFTYASEMKVFNEKFQDEVENVIRNYDTLIEEAKERLGSMFKKSEYPTKDELRAKYDFRLNIYPVPDSDDFRLELNQNEINNMKAEMEENLKKIQENATKDIWKRLYKVVQHMANTLKEEDKQFQKSTVENIKILCDILPDLNIGEDGLLEEMRLEVIKKLTEQEPDTLRTDKIIRKDIADQAEELANKILSYTR